MFLPREYTAATSFLPSLHSQSEEHWIHRGQKRALKLFHAMADRVPAYRDFLKKNKVNPAKIKTITDFCALPPTGKENYLLSYPLDALCWDGELESRQHMIASTSGSTGRAFYFPRTKVQDAQFAFTAELLFREYFSLHKKTTLFIDCFALGVWIGGMYMYQAMKYLSDTGRYKLSIITPGAYKEEAIKAIEQLASHYDQVIIGGYAPLVKDLIDDGQVYGLKWKNYNVKFFFAAEGFDEGFRDYIYRACGITDLYFSSFNHYGTADMGTMSHETPVTILLRRLALQNAGLYRRMFGEANRLPSLTQFIPELYYFESVNGELFCSSASGLPLVRYDLKDRGGVFSLAQAAEWSQLEGINIGAEEKQANIKSTLWHLPCVYVYERKDLVASIYSVNIYPECIRRSLQTKQLEKYLTTKFSMMVRYDKKQNQYLEINIELKSGAKESAGLKTKVLNEIIVGLDRENSEWRDFYADPGIRHKVIPRLVFWPYQHPAHFKPGAKQKWIKKS